MVQSCRGLGSWSLRRSLEELDAKLPEFSKAYHDDGLALGEYADFGPVQLFRNMFLEGQGQLLAQLAGRRQGADPH